MIISELEPMTHAGASDVTVHQSPDAPRLAPVLTFEESTDPEWAEQVPNSRENPMRRDVRQLLKLLERIHHADNKSQMRRQIASNFPGRRGYEEQSLKRKYELYVYGGCKKRCAEGRCHCPAELRFEPGDAWCLVDFARAPREENKSLRYETIQFYMACCDDNQRNDEAGYREFINVWRQGVKSGRGFRRVGTQTIEYKKFPGYDGWPAAAWHGKFPTGCSSSQLRRAAVKFGRDDYAKELARVGRASARTHALKVITTRVGLPFGALMQFDDHEDNVKIRWPDQQRFLRPRGFHVYERLSGSVFFQCVKPTLWDADLGKKEALKLLDFRWSVIAVLMAHGYRNDETGTRMIWEHGTANDDALAEMIKAVTKGRVWIEKSGRFGQRAHDGQYDPSTPGHGKGNYRRKAGLESWFALRDSYQAMLAGQTGLDRNHCPEQLAGVERETLAIVRACEGLDPERAAKLQAPLLNWPEFAALSSELHNAIETRRDHNLEGWEKCGFLKTSYLVDGDWIKQEELKYLGEAKREIILARALEQPALTNAVRLSPREVWTRHAGELTKLHWRHLPDLAGEENAHRNSRESDGTYPVRAGVFEIDDASIGFGTMMFEAINLEGRRLFNGQRYLCFINPLLPTHLVACDAGLRVVGICPAIVAPNALDTKAIGEQQGKQARWELEVRTDLNHRHAAEAAHITQVREHNAAVIGAKSVGRAPARQPQAGRTEPAGGSIADAALANLPD